MHIRFSRPIRHVNFDIYTNPFTGRVFASLVSFSGTDNRFYSFRIEPEYKNLTVASYAMIHDLAVSFTQRTLQMAVQP